MADIRRARPPELRPGPSGPRNRVRAGRRSNAGRGREAARGMRRRGGAGSGTIRAGPARLSRYAWEAQRG